MNPVTNENIPEKKIETVENKVEKNIPTQTEASPPIKTEENQANWKAFREQREVERKARMAAEQRASEKAAEAEAMREALEAAINKPSNNHQEKEYTSHDTEETEEQRIDRRVNKIIKEREEQYQKEQQQREMQEYPQRLNQMYPDFNKTISSENLDYLDFHYPEVSKPLQRLQEGFDKWADIYRAVKKFVPNMDSKQDMQRAEKNLSKPGSISTPGSTQGSGAMPSARLTEERKAENWARMERARKGLT
jgi:hypothetical protein